MSSDFREGAMSRRVPVVLAILVLVAGGALAGKSKFNAVLGPGDRAPDWKDLVGVDGNTNSLKDFARAKALVIVFTCNRCPVSKAYEDRVIALSKKWQHGRGEHDVYVVAINVSRHPADSYEKMQERALAKKYPFVYAHDPSQVVGKAHGVTVSLQTFVLDEKQRIAYLGAFDDNTDPEKVTKHYVEDAVQALLDGKAPPVAESLPRGCPVDYGDTPSETDE